MKNPLIISHIADIHFRGLSRHDEYRSVFEAYAEQCKSLGVTHIFVGGDIFHTKTSGISPEYIDVLTWWLKLLGSTAKVHMILGNHDGNLSNSSRQDAVSPIVNALAHPNVTLYKHSGVYSIEEGVNLCVFSLFDKENWDSVKPVDDQFNIACFHGSVKGAMTETDWEVEGEIEIDRFREFDACFLGDIHRPQILDYRPVGDKRIPWIAYPGSTLQQNYGENQDHFHIVWTIKGKNDFNMEFKQLPNPCPFVTLEWGGNVDLTLSSIDQYPNGSRFRLKSSDYVSQKEIYDLTKRLRAEKAAAEITFTSTNASVPEKKTLTSTGLAFTKSDLRNAETIIRLMKNMHKKADISDESWEKMNEIVSKYLTNVSLIDDVPRNVKWSLRKLEFDNIFSYGDGNVISFENLNGIVGLFGRNRLGKSSIVGSILYSLFNATDRGSIKNLHVINVRKPSCYAKSIINIGGVDYIIERQSVKHESKKGVISANTSLNLFKMQDGEAIDLVGEQRSDTEKIVRSLIGTVDDFLTTCASTQGDVNRFISEGSAQRKAFMSKLLDLDIFDALLTQAKEDVNSLKARINALPKELDDNFIKEQEGFISTSSQRIEKLSEDHDEQTSQLLDYQKALSLLSQSAPVTLTQIEDVKSVIKTQQSKIQRVESERDESLEKIEIILKKMKDNDSIIKKNDVDSLKSELQKIVDAETELKDVKQKLESEDKELKRHLKVVSTLNEVPCGDDYPTCKFIKDAHDLKPTVTSQRKKVKTLTETVDKLASGLLERNKEDVVKKLDDVTKAIRFNEQSRINISSIRVEIANFEVELQKLTTTLDSLTVKYNEMLSSHSKQQNDELAGLKERIKNVQLKLKEIDSEKMKLSGEIGSAKSRIEKYKSDVLLKSSLLEEMRLYELASVSFSKKGLPSVITNDQLPIINREIAQILGGIVDFTTELAMEDDGSLEVYINYGDSRRLIELCSGMEKMISSLAIRTALTNISSLPKSDVFIIDEGFGALDETNVDACVKLLRSLKQYFKTILIISHTDGIKDAVDTMIEINKAEKDSRVVYE